MELMKREEEKRKKREARRQKKQEREEKAREKARVEALRIKNRRAVLKEEMKRRVAETQVQYNGDDCLVCFVRLLTTLSLSVSFVIGRLNLPSRR